MNSLGYRLSHKKILKFERRAATLSRLHYRLQAKRNLSYVYGWHVEHNLCTLNRENTLHAMGMIALITYEKLAKRKEEILFRRKRFWVCYLLVCYLLYKDKSWHQTIIIFQPVYSNRILHTSNVDLLFNLAWMFKNPVPLWPGTWFAQQMNWLSSLWRQYWHSLG